jgi:thioredoxin reductase (NADPH)
VLPFTEVTGLHGERSLTAVDLTTSAADGTTSSRTVDATGVFSFIGAVADTEWLGTLVERDADGFVLTDHDVPDTTDALAFETSQAGVFAVGDVRHGSMKRVAAAAGEGSSAVRSVHQRLTPA